MVLGKQKLNGPEPAGLIVIGGSYVSLTSYKVDSLLTVQFGPAILMLDSEQWNKGGDGLT